VAAASEAALRAMSGVGTGRAFPECDKWRKMVLQRIIDDPPELVITASAIPIYFRQVPDLTQGLIRLIHEIPSQSRVVLVAGTPIQRFNPPSCLAAHLDNAAACSVRRVDGLPDEVIKHTADAAAATGATHLDFSDYFCSDVCPVIIADTLIYFDPFHITATAARPFTPLFKAAIERALSGPQRN
jgi:hypothetical protein